MKLLFDENLSPRLVSRLAGLFPDSSHVHFHSLDHRNDREVWDFALAEGFAIVTKDSDFSDLALLRGFPPKVVWLRLGNCSTSQAEALLRTHAGVIQQFADDPDAGVLALQ